MLCNSNNRGNRVCCSAIGLCSNLPNVDSTSQVQLNWKDIEMLTIPIIINAGSTINTTCEQMITLSKITKSYIQGRFNGVTLIAEPSGNPKILADSYTKVLRDKEETDKTAYSYPLHWKDIEMRTAQEIADDIADNSDKYHYSTTDNSDSWLNFNRKARELWEEARTNGVQEEVRNILFESRKNN
jgi:hypothetical protein